MNRYLFVDNIKNGHPGIFISEIIFETMCRIDPLCRFEIIDGLFLISSRCFRWNQTRVFCWLVDWRILRKRSIVGLVALIESHSNKYEKTSTYDYRLGDNFLEVDLHSSIAWLMWIHEWMSRSICSEVGRSCPWPIVLVVIGECWTTVLDLKKIFLRNDGRSKEIYLERLKSSTFFILKWSE